MPSIAEVIARHKFAGARCVVPGCREWAVEAHHVTYRPPKIVPICHNHHNEITDINGQEAKGALTSNQRRTIWRRFLRGEFSKRLSKPK